MANLKLDQINNMGGNISREETGNATSTYVDYFKENDSTKRKDNYADVVNKYYDLSTSFYEYGWGESFHFAHMHKGEKLNESIRRHEHYLGMKMALKQGDKVMDLGCGVGGPLREIAYFTGAHIIGVNNNAYQVQRGKTLNARTGRHENCDLVKADFMELPFDDGTFDAAYEIEATCHAPDIRACYAQIYRKLKPGGVFASYEWCLTDAFDPNNPAHAKCKLDISLGNGLPDIRQTTECLQALKDAGFEVLEEEDLVKTADVPWYQPIDPDRRFDFSLQALKTTRVGRNVTHYAVAALEKVGIAPKGSVDVSSFLKVGADALVEGGKLGIFTPMYFTLARKPK